MRIIGGTWRSRVLRFPPRTQLRPTPDRVRETLFNWLGQELAGLDCLDLFAGSGALGFEAASRGARCVVMVERDFVTYAALNENRSILEALQVETVKADALQFLRRDARSYHVVFLDPPFADNRWAEILPALVPRLTPDGVVYCESGGVPELPAGWEVWKQARAGQVTYQLIRRAQHGSQGDISGDV